MRTLGGSVTRASFHAVKNQKSMRHKNVEADLLLAVQQKGAAFEDAHNRCRERPMSMLQECLEPVARDYRDALNAFSEFILEGRNENKPEPRVFRRGPN